MKGRGGRFGEGGREVGREGGEGGREGGRDNGKGGGGREGKDECYTYSNIMPSSDTTNSLSFPA